MENSSPALGRKSRKAASKIQKRKRTDILQLIYQHRHQCLKQLLPQLKALNWKDVKDCQDTYGSYPLHYVMFYCTGNGVLETVQYILQQDPDALYKTTNHQMTPLHVMPGVVFSGEVHKYSLESIQRDQLKARSFMMKQDASILTHLNGFGRSTLSEAVVKGCNRIAKQILKDYPHLVFEKEANGRIPLYHAIQQENAVATTLLISYYPKSLLVNPHNEHQPASSSAQDQKQHQTFLQMALASPALALPVCQRMEMIMADLFTLHQELINTENKLKASTATIRTKTAEAKVAASQIQALQGQLAVSAGESRGLIANEATERKNDAFSACTAPIPLKDSTTRVDARQEFYWKQTRQSETICLNSLTQGNQEKEPSVEDLKAIAGSLSRRLDCHTNSSSSEENKTMAQIAAEYCLKHPNPERRDLYRTIAALNEELTRMEGMDKMHDGDSADEASLSGTQRKRQAPKTQQPPKYSKRPKAAAESNIDSGKGVGERADAMWL
ncbi:MAG: hypothetical protein SGBAC_005441 [Bacillariaceae sp.]